MEFLIETDRIYEISELVKSVSFTDKLNDGCSKLEFSFIDDNLKIENGNIVRFVNNDIKFFGIVFKHGRNKKGEITVTAYDKLRYCKPKDTIAVSPGTTKDTISTLVKKMCNYFKLSTGNIADTKYVLATKYQEDKTWLDIVYDAINKTNINTGKWYCLRDEYGNIAVRDLDDLRLNLVLGDASLVYDYEYSKSIDENFYNRIIFHVKGNETRTDSFVLEDDTNSITKYGLLQLYDVAGENLNVSQVKDMAKVLLKTYGQEAEALSLDCLGDTRIRAGTSFYVQIKDIGLLKQLFVKSVTHNFFPIHTMQIEVTI